MLKELDLKLFYVFHCQSHDSKLDDVCHKSEPGTRSRAGRRKTSPPAQWMAAAGTLFPAFPACSQHSVHNTQCWRQIVGTEQKKDKLLFFAFHTILQALTCPRWCFSCALQSSLLVYTNLTFELVHRMRILNA